MDILKKIFVSSIFPFWFFHIPIFPFYLFLSIKRGNLAFFTNVNPSWIMGGFVNNSKIDALREINDKWLPKTLYFSQVSTLKEVEIAIKLNQIKYPIILKPDKGERGLGVSKINDRRALKSAVKTAPLDFLIQEFIDYPLEFGVLYYKLPLTGQAGIASIGLKEMPSVIGNGKETLSELVKKKYHLQYFENLNSDNEGVVIKKDHEFVLEYIAHRNRKCVFKNYNHLISNSLLANFQRITSDMDKFYFGRFDVKVKSTEDLINGNNLKVMEVNGVNSLPIHIFDPSYSFFKCYKALHDHWNLIYQISKQNSLLGFQPSKAKRLIIEIAKKL